MPYGTMLAVDSSESVSPDIVSEGVMIEAMVLARAFLLRLLLRGL